MSTRKQIIEGLISKTQELRSSMGENTEATKELIRELDRLQSDLSNATNEVALTTDNAIQHLSDRLTDLSSDIARALSIGAHEMGNEIRKGLIEGHIVGQVIANNLKSKDDTPMMTMAKKINHAINIISASFRAGSRHDYESTLQLLRAHEFRAEQARYIVDLLLKKYNVLSEFTDEDGVKYIAIDMENETTQHLIDRYKEGIFVYLA